MSPHTIVSLFVLVGGAADCFALAFFLPKKREKIRAKHCVFDFRWRRHFFFAAEPFVIKYQTEKAALALENHLSKLCPENRWAITDTDSDRIKAAIRLHVRFENEPNMIYEYVIRKAHIRQIDRWTTSGRSPEKSGIQPEPTAFQKRTQEATQ